MKLKFESVSIFLRVLPPTLDLEKVSLLTKFFGFHLKKKKKKVYGGVSLLTKGECSRKIDNVWMSLWVVFSP